MEADNASINPINWFDLPYDVRNMIIETMDTPTKCKFAACSKQCEEEVKLSHNFLDLVDVHHQLYEMTLITCTSLHVKSNDLDLLFVFCSNFVLKKVLEDDENEDDIVQYEARIVNCNIPDGFNIFESWQTNRNGKELAATKLAKYFENILKYASNSSLGLIIDSDHFPYEKTNVRHLRNLESFKDLDNRDVNLPEIDLIENGFLTFSQLTQITGRLHLSNTSLSLDQIFELKAKCIVANSSGITSQQLNELLKSWRNDEVEIKFGIVSIHKIDPEVDGEVITSGLGVKTSSTKAYLSNTPLGRAFLELNPRREDAQSFQLPKIDKPQEELLVKCTSNTFEMLDNKYLDERIEAALSDMVGAGYEF